MSVATREAWQLLNELRDNGWCVAAHNDYRSGQVPMTFWLLTKDTPGAGIIGVRGEGYSDLEALEQCAVQARVLYKLSP